MASQMLGGGEAGPGNHVAQDGPAEIVPRGGREAGTGAPILQNAVQGFWGKILVQPSQVPAIGNKAEKRPGPPANPSDSERHCPPAWAWLGAACCLFR